MESRAARRIAGFALAAGFLGVLFLAWLPFDPLEAPAPRLDRIVPDTVELAVRTDGAALLRSPLLARVREHPAARPLLDRLDVDGRLLSPLRRLEDAFRERSLGLADPPSLSGDLVPAECIVALRGEDALLVTRISSRARAVELVRKVAAEDLASAGLAIEGRFLRVRRGDRELWVARVSDVLVAATSRALAFDAVLCAERGDGHLAARPGFGDALRLSGPVGARVVVWADPGTIARHVRAGLEARGGAPVPSGASASPGGPATSGTGGAAGVRGDPWWLAVLDARPDSVQVELDLTAADGLRFRGALPFRADRVPEILGAFPDAPRGAGTADGATDGAAAAASHLAARYTTRDETIVSGGTTAHAGAVLGALLRSLPREHQVLVDDALAQAGETTQTVADELGRHFDAGIGFSVARVREAESIHDPDDEPGAVHAIPATCVLFRLREPDGGAAFLDALRRRALLLFDRELTGTPEDLPGGAKLWTLERRGLDGAWELFRPALATDLDRVFFSTHEGHLRRVLREALRGTGGAGGGAGGSASRVASPDGALSLRLAAEPLRRFTDDQRWAHADRVTQHDWKAERQELAAKLSGDGRGDPLALSDRLDAEIRARAARRRTVEAPAAAAAYQRAWSWLALLGDGGIDVRRERSGDTVTIAFDGELGLAEE